MSVGWDLRLTFRTHFVDQAHPHPRLHVPFVASITVPHPGSPMAESQDAAALKAHIEDALGPAPLPNRRTRNASRSRQTRSDRPPRPRCEGRARAGEQTTKMTEVLSSAIIEGVKTFEHDTAPRISWLDDVEQYKPFGKDSDVMCSQRAWDTYQMAISHRLRQVALSRGFIALQRGADLSALDEESQTYAKIARILDSVMEKLSETRGHESGWVCAALIGNRQAIPSQTFNLTTDRH